MKNIRVLGIMSGTSLDGVDFVLSSWDTHLNGRYLGHESLNFPKTLQKRLLACAEGSTGIRDAARLHHELGRFYADSTKKLISKKRWKIDLIGLHGQTVFHQAPQATLQIGEPSYLATATGRPVVADFRVADLSAGGQGAPLATFFHALLLRKFLLDGPCTFHNLGGISNVSYFPKGQIDISSLNRKPIGGQALSFDTGPANMLIDSLMHKFSKPFDDKGHLAASGLVDFDLVHKWLKTDSFVNTRPPKSCGREEYGQARFQKFLRDMRGMNRRDQAATITEFTALTIAHSYNKYLPTLPKLSVFSGGGTLNSYLMFRIRYHLPQVKIISSEDLGWPAQAIEGGAFGLLAVARYLGKFGQLPQTTGASRPVLLGKIVQTTI